MEQQKIFVTKSTMPKFEDYCKKIKPIWTNHIMTNNGPLHVDLEEKLKKYLKVKNICLFANGHLSLESALESLNMKKGGEIITTPFTFVSTINAIVRKGFNPVFCDIKEDNYTMDPEKMEKLINNNTVAILPVHVYGNICDVEKIEEIAKKNELNVIYDGAHAFGEKINEKTIGNFGDITMFSFHATKVFNTIEGGCLTFKNNNLKNILEKIKNFGIKSPEEIDYIGGNSKMNEFQAAMGLCNLEILDEEISKRKKLYEVYIKCLKDVKGIVLNKQEKNIKYNYSYFPIVINEEYKLSRDSLVKLLNSNDIYPRKYFYPAVNEIECYKNINNKTPIAHYISKRVLTLPLYPTMKISTIKKICNLIKEGGK